MIEKVVLKNGIPVFISENHASPVVSIQAWVARGSVHETKPLAGVSHFLEHALFKGTKKRKVGEIALEIEARGGEVNAYTSFEETVYYTTMASRYFEDGMDIISDAVSSPLFDPIEMAREREVILEEIKRAWDSPSRILFYNLWNNAFKNTPYGRPILGYEETVRKIGHVQLKKYFDSQYHANSMSVFIVGDISVSKVKQLAQKTFGKVKRKPSLKAPKIKVVSVPKQTTAHIESVEKDVQHCQIQVGYPSVPLADPSIPALDIACNILGSGESSRLYQYLVKEKQVALSCQMGLISTQGCGMVILSLVTEHSKLKEALECAMETIQKARTFGFTEEELERVKSGMESEAVYSKETVGGYAKRIGYYFNHFGDPDYERLYLENILMTDLEQANLAPQKVLSQAPFVSIVHPKEKKIALAEIKKALKLPKMKGLPKPIVQVKPALFEKKQSAFILKESHFLPTIATRIIFRGGSREEPESQQGLGNIFESVWGAGTQNYSSLKIASRLEALGASVSPFMGKNTLGLSFECLRKHWPQVKPIVSEILTVPTFPESEFVTEKNIALRQIAAEKDVPSQLCFRGLLTRLYPNHSYGRSALGREETVSGLKVQDLKDFHAHYINKKEMVVSSVGAFDTEYWLKEMEDLTAPLPLQGKAILPFRSLNAPSHVIVHTEKKTPLHQSHLAIGFLATDFKNPDRYALKLLSSCLSGQGGRLFLELRDKMSLAYTVAPIHSEGPEPGHFSFYIACSPEKVEASIKAIRAEIEKIISVGIRPKELERAKKYFLGRFELEMQRYSSQAMLFGLDEIYGHGFLHSFEVPSLIKATTSAQILQAAKRYLDVSKAVISIVHPEELESSWVESVWKG